MSSEISLSGDSVKGKINAAKIREKLLSRPGKFEGRILVGLMALTSGES